MNILLDTNVILNVIRAKNPVKIKDFINPDNSLIYISIVSEAELKSLAIRNRWGSNRISALNSFLESVSTIDVNQLSANAYAEIDAYSQRLNPNFKTYPFATPRNMGKNDLWIASIAVVLGLKLITTDADFDHLHNIFFEVRKLNSSDFLPFL
jgi:tRNA(fMet)-specific endonuclease VapC